MIYMAMASEHEKGHPSKYSPLAAQPWTLKTQTRSRQESDPGKRHHEPGSPAVCQSPGEQPCSCSLPPALALRTLAPARGQTQGHRQAQLRLSERG